MTPKSAQKAEPIWSRYLRGIFILVLASATAWFAKVERDITQIKIHQQYIRDDIVTIKQHLEIKHAEVTYGRH